jgi:hypothetical protein
VIDIAHIGNPTTIPNWPKNTLEGLFDALSRWALDPTWLERGDEKPFVLIDYPYRCRAWCTFSTFHDANTGRAYYVATEPRYPDNFGAVTYCGNFVGYSFGFNLSTDEPDLITSLDAAIAKNMASDAFLAAKAEHEKRRAFFRRGHTA